jgi:type II secretory pathway pseudopilin PulG
MYMKTPCRLQRGITLIEVAVSITIITAILVVVGFSVNAYVEARSQLLVNAKALYLAEEGYEIIRALRDDDWSTFEGLSNNTTQYLSVATTTIGVGVGPEEIDAEFVRSFTLEAVYRDGDDDVVDSSTPGAVVDPDTRLVTVSVAGPTGTTTLQAVLANIHAQ